MADSQDLLAVGTLSDELNNWEVHTIDRASHESSKEIAESSQNSLSKFHTIISRFRNSLLIISLKLCYAGQETRDEFPVVPYRNIVARQRVNIHSSSEYEEIRDGTPSMLYIHGRRQSKNQRIQWMA